MTAMTDEKQVSDDRLREIIAGCEGVTPGPWRPLDALNSHYYVLSNTETFGFGGGPHRQHVALMTKNYGVDTSSVRDRREQTNAAHIARLDPQTVAAICSELLARRSQEPDGWQLVPVEPTEAMVREGVNEAHRQGGSYAASAIYRAMLAVAPQSTEGK